jgi:hypothetical protein
MVEQAPISILGNQNPGEAGRSQTMSEHIDEAERRNINALLDAMREARETSVAPKRPPKRRA